MESYVLRIYRRDQDAPERLVGTLEFVDEQETQSFQTIGELMSFLVLPAIKRTARPDSMK